MGDAVEVVRALLQDYSDDLILQLIMIGANHVKVAADAQPWSKSLSPLESANGYISRRMDYIINYIGGVLND